MYKAQRMSESSFSHSFIAVFLFSFVSNATNFFLHTLHRFVLKKSYLHVASFLQLGAAFIPCIYKYTF